VETSLLHQLWHIINETQTKIVLELDDLNLVKYISIELEKKRILSFEEHHLVRCYLSTKMPLIRDLANARLWTF
jgi:hypothetical protein